MVPGRFLAIESIRHIAPYSPPLIIKSPIDISSSTYLSINLSSTPSYLPHTTVRSVYQINNRGSSGYGKTFFHLDDLKHGEADLGDVVASRAFLAAYEWIDGERVGIIGGSYGGYMVAAALAFEPESFEVKLIRKSLILSSLI